MSNADRRNAKKSKFVIYPKEFNVMIESIGDKEVVKKVKKSLKKNKK